MSDATPAGASPGDGEKYDQMMALADFFDATGSELRHRAGLAGQVLGDPDVHDSAELSPRTFTAVEAGLRAVSTGKLGLQTRSVELDADALVVRATVLTYRWIDELQEVAYHTLGSIAGRAIGYLAPQVALGGAIVSAGLIETDALDRDDVAAYLSDLAERNPDLREHLTSGGGGLLESLEMRALLTSGMPADGAGREAGRRAVGVPPLPADAAAALRDVAAGLAPPTAAPDRRPPGGHEPVPSGLEALLETLLATESSVHVDRIADTLFIAYLPGPHVGLRGLRLVGDDGGDYGHRVVEALRTAVAGTPDARVLLVGIGQGGVTAARVAAEHDGAGFVIEQVVAAGAPAAQVPRLPEPVRMLSLEERTDPVALLGAVLNAGDERHTTVVFESREPGPAAYVAGGRAADGSGHPGLVTALGRLRGLGFLAG